jgi:hypothetical protein
MRANPHFAAGASAALALCAVLAGTLVFQSRPAVRAQVLWPVELPAAAQTGEPTVQPTVAPTSEPTGEPTSTEIPTVAPTPIVDPPPPPVPRFVPLVLASFDFRAPPPAMASARGYVQPLDQTFRDLCSPGTHALLENEHSEHPDMVALAYSLREDNPATELDLYVGSYVELSGLESPAPSGCGLSSRVIGVDRVEVLDEPGRPTPGG